MRYPLPHPPRPISAAFFPAERTGLTHPSPASPSTRSGTATARTSRAASGGATARTAPATSPTKHETPWCTCVPLSDCKFRALLLSHLFFLLALAFAFARARRPTPLLTPPRAGRQVGPVCHPSVHSPVCPSVVPVSMLPVSFRTSSSTVRPGAAAASRAHAMPSVTVLICSPPSGCHYGFHCAAHCRSHSHTPARAGSPPLKAGKARIRRAR